uniref:Uncharacterized protein n=1 Tax=viral metagenome TaxID=1070528 RepID=A0A6C0BPK6_9ZZZZ
MPLKRLRGRGRVKKVKRVRRKFGLRRKKLSKRFLLHLLSDVTLAQRMARVLSGSDLERKFIQDNLAGGNTRLTQFVRRTPVQELDLNILLHTTDHYIVRLVDFYRLPDIRILLHVAKRWKVELVLKKDDKGFVYTHKIRRGGHLGTTKNVRLPVMLNYYYLDHEILIPLLTYDPAGIVLQYYSY